MSEFKFFINEDGGVYAYDPIQQPIEFPGDYPVAYDSVAEAWEAAKTVVPWNGPEDDEDEEEFDDWGYPQSWEQVYADQNNSDSYINYLNGH